MQIEQIIKEGQGTIVDVRTIAEFRGGNVANSINIPLQEIELRLDEVKNLKQPLILCLQWWLLVGCQLFSNTLKK